MHNTISQGSSSEQGSVIAHQGSTGTRSPPHGRCHGQHPHNVEHNDEKGEECMKHDLLGIGTQFGNKK